MKKHLRILLVALTACGHHEAAPNAGPSTTGTAHPSATVASPAASTSGAAAAATRYVAAEPVAGKRYAFVVQFGSPGDGTDTEAEDRLARLVAEVGGARLGHASGLWGREGETDECFELVQLTAAERASFVARARVAAAGAKQSFAENALCRSR